MKEIRVGLIGCGAVAPTHLYSYKKIPGATVEAVCDLDEGKASAMASRFGIPHVARNVAELVQNPELDLIDICTDHASHSPIAVAALNAGKNVVCEKCLSNSLEGLDAMLAARRRHPELLFAGIFQHRHERANRLLKRLMEEGKFGRMLNASVHMVCQRPNSYYQDYWHGKWNGEGGSFLITQIIHFIDLTNYFLGNPQSVMAQCNNLMHQGVIETEDNTGVLVRYPDGVLATFCGSSASVIDKGFRCNVILAGTQGHVVLSGFRPEFWKFHDIEAQKEMDALMESFQEEPAPDPAKPHYGGGHPEQLADVVAAIREHRDPYVTVEKAAVTARLILNCYQSAKTGNWIELPQP
ncbi:MAG: Gfo/Idh/MocA family oxidoreductase [Victivallales bacterium]|nr:Gfo/Idh/MocA family oxidoreductase [Victivallales bacterium]